MRGDVRGGAVSTEEAASRFAHWTLRPFSTAVRSPALCCPPGCCSPSSLYRTFGSHAPYGISSPLPAERSREIRFEEVCYLEDKPFLSLGLGL